jgi:hypothetical protein
LRGAPPGKQCEAGRDHAARATAIRHPTRTQRPHRQRPLLARQTRRPAVLFRRG